MVTKEPVGGGEASPRSVSCLLLFSMQILLLCACVQLLSYVETEPTALSFPASWTGWSANWRDWSLHQVSDWFLSDERGL